jgi:hypothetical protein
MKTSILKLALLLAFVMIAAQLASCDKLKNIKGSIAGQIIDSNGVGIGFVSVAIIDENGTEVTRETTNNEGGFFIGDLTGGTYSIQVWNMGTQQMTITSDNAQSIYLGIGKTETVDITVEVPEKKN